MVERQDVAGVYRQVGPIELVVPDGSVTPTGKAPDAQVIYTAEGYYSFVTVPSDRPRLSGTDRPDLTDAAAEEMAAAVANFVFLAGRYELGPGAVTHHVDFSLNPNLVGGTVVRDLWLDTDGFDLTLSFVRPHDGSRRRVRWERLSAW